MKFLLKLVSSLTLLVAFSDFNVFLLANHSNVMQMRVKKYFEYLHYEEQEDNEDG
jgi:hypothetical protein